MAIAFNEYETVCNKHLILGGVVCRTIKAQYYKNSFANFIRKDGMGATAVIVFDDKD